MPAYMEGADTISLLQILGIVGMTGFIILIIALTN